MIDFLGLVIFATVVGIGLLDAKSGLSPFAADAGVTRRAHATDAAVTGTSPGRQRLRDRSVGSAMSDKSPRQSATKKSGRSIKEKRLIKKSRKAVAENDRMTVFLRGEPGSPAKKA